MKLSRTAPIALAAMFVFACGGSEVDDPETYANVRDADLPADPGIDLGDPDLELAEPIRVGDLVVWPVLDRSPATRPRPDEDYLTLDEALEGGVAEVIETGNVNQLSLRNTSDRPILLLSGEVLRGGKQDRIVASDVAVAPHSEEPLASFCVEQGRWDGVEGSTFESTGAIAAAPVRAAAQVAGDQGLVWANVAGVSSLNGLRPSTGTYTALLDDDDVQDRVARRARRLIEALEKREEVVGMVVALHWGGEEQLLTAEVFRDRRLFGRYRDKLARAYALDSLTREQSGGELLESETRALRSLGYMDSSYEAAPAALRAVHRTIYQR